MWHICVRACYLPCYDIVPHIQKQQCLFVISESKWDLLVISFKVQNTNNHLSIVPVPYMKNNCHNEIPPLPSSLLWKSDLESA